MQTRSRAGHSAWARNGSDTQGPRAGQRLDLAGAGWTAAPSEKKKATTPTWL